MRIYELVMVFSPELDEQEVANSVERVTHFISERGGSVNSQEEWGVRRLAYPILGFNEGKYLLTEFASEAAPVVELEASLKASSEIIRHLLVKKAT